MITDSDNKESRRDPFGTPFESDTSRRATGKEQAGTVSPAFRTIGEVAALLKVPPHAIRYWEKQFPLVRPLRRSNGRRYYANNDLELIAGIRQLLFVDGFTTLGAQRILGLRGVEFVRAIGRGEASALIPLSEPAMPASRDTSRQEGR